MAAVSHLSVNFIDLSILNITPCGLDVFKEKMTEELYETLKDSVLPIILYGMGNGADKIWKEFSRRGIVISGIMASDDFVRGQRFHEFTVKHLSDFEALYGDFVIITAFGTSVPSVMEHIRQLEQRHPLYAADVPVYGEHIWDRQYYEQNRTRIEQAYALLSDSRSRDVFEKVIQYKLSGKLSYLRSAYSDKDEVFRELLQITDDESYLDLGAYRGDTIDELLHYSGGGYRDITALEPDKKTFAKLKAHAGTWQRVHLYRMGIWSEDTDLPFDSALGRGSNIRQGGSELLPVTKVDTLYKRRRLTYLKMDVEGCEREAIIGAAETLRRDRPKLNIAVYHRSEDIFSLPLLIHSIEPDYQFFLRQHPYVPAWDLNLYCRRAPGIASLN